LIVNWTYRGALQRGNRLQSPSQNLSQAIEHMSIYMTVLICIKSVNSILTYESSISLFSQLSNNSDAIFLESKFLFIFQRP